MAVSEKQMAVQAPVRAPGREQVKAGAPPTATGLQGRAGPLAVIPISVGQALSKAGLATGPGQEGPLPEGPRPKGEILQQGLKEDLKLSPQYKRALLTQSLKEGPQKERLRQVGLLKEGPQKERLRQIGLLQEDRVESRVPARAPGPRLPKMDLYV